MRIAEELRELIEQIERNVRAHDIESDDEKNTAIVTLGTLKRWEEACRNA